MDCETCRARLTPYLETALEADEAAALAAHLDGCDGCRLVLDELRLERLAAAAAPGDWTVPAELAAAAWQQAHERLGDPLLLALGEGLPAPPLRLGGALAAAAVVAAMLWSAAPSGEPVATSDRSTPSVALAWLDRVDESAVEPPSWPLPRRSGSSSPSSCLPSSPRPPRGPC